MKQPIQTEHAPKAIGPYSQAIKVGQTIYLSGQIPLNVETQAMVSDDFRAQAIQVVMNLQALAQAAGGNLDDIVKLTVYLTNFNDFPTLNEVMMDFFNEPYPARVTIQAAALPKAAKVEIDAIMHLKA